MESPRSPHAPSLFPLAVAGALVILIGGGAVAWLWLARQPPPDASARPTAPAVAEHMAADAALVAAGAADGGVGAAATAEPGARPAEAAPPAAADDERGRSALVGELLRGTLAVPAGAPSDESLRVVARERAALDAVESGGLMRGNDDAPDELAGAAVDALGHFEIPLADLPERFAVDVDGRFLYLDQPLDVERRALDGAPLALAPLLGASVRGQLVPPDPDAAAPGGGAQIELTRPAIEWAMRGAKPEARRAVADERGAFELRGIPAWGEWNLAAEAGAYACEPLRGIALAPGETRELAIALVLGATLAGRVVDPEGAAVAGAEVAAGDTRTLWGGGAVQGRKATTGADGRFELAGVAAGAQRLLVEAEGFLTSSAMSVEVAPGEARTDIVVTLERGEPLAGVVTWPDGAPAVDAAVMGTLNVSPMGANAMSAWRGAEASDRTEADGRFVLHGLAPGEVKLTASGSRSIDGSTEFGHAELAAADRALGETRLVLAPTAALAGRVETPDGAPIERFRLGWKRASPRMSFDRSSLASESRDFEDPRGSFSIPGLAPGSWSVWAESEGAAPSELVEVELPPAEGASELAIVLQPAARVSGVVRDPSGKPLTHANVAVQENGGSPWLAALRGGAQPAVAASDAEGRFELAPLRGGALALIAKHPDFASSGPLALELAPGEARAGVELVLRVGGTITGEVYGNDGAPAAGVMVMAAIPDGSNARNSSTDAAGRFAVEHLDPGSWQVIAMLSMDDAIFGSDADGSADDGTGAEAAGAATSFLDGMKFTIAAVEDGKETHVVLGAPPAHPVEVEGTLTAAGVGVQAMVSFLPEGEDPLGGMKITASGADGRFEQRLDKPGRYVVSVQSGAFGGPQSTVEFRRTIPEEERCELALELPLGRITGRVRGPDGQAAAGARVTLAADGAVRAGSLIGQQYAEGLTDAEGAYAFEWLAAGRYSVAAGGSFMNGLFGAPEAGGRKVIGGLELDEGQVLERVDFRLEAAGKLVGRVTDGAGNPVAGAAVFAREQGGRLVERFSSTVSDGSGSYTVDGLAAGTYTLFARAGARASPESAPVEVRAGEEARADLPLGAGTLLLVRVELGEDEEILADVSVVDAAGREVNGVLSMQDVMQGLAGGLKSGESRVGPLAPGVYRVTATTPDGRSKTKPVELAGQPERSLVVRIKE